MRRYDINPLYRYFTKVMGKENVDKLFSLYRVGTSKRWGGATVFWQTDRDGNVRAGKIMGYDAVTGHRIKEPFNQVSWVHSVRKVPDFRMKQCLFGEHLLSDTSAAMSAKPVAIVESEKTALVAAHFIPDFIWLATGGMHGCFNGEAIQVLDGREVILFPDLKATEEWRQRLLMLESFCRRATCSDLLERIATNEQRSQGLDIADFLLIDDSAQSRIAVPHRRFRARTGGCRERRMTERHRTACCPKGKGVVKSRSLLGHFHRLRSASGSQKAHSPREYLRPQIYASGNKTGFYNRNDNHKTN